VLGITLPPQAALPDLLAHAVRAWGARWP
jgi:hypothetical protein